MRRVEDFRENAKACRDLATKTEGALRDHLLRMASEWDHFAEERERQLAAGKTTNGANEG